MKKSILFSITMCAFIALHAQNLGIGTPTPDATLDVNGTFKVSDGSQGEGKILTSDAAGLASWQTPPLPPVHYESVWICCNAWMTKNLDASTYRNGDPIPKVTNNAEWISLTTGAYCYYNNDSTTYAAIYGKLYNWYAVNDPRGLAPIGWHIPSTFEWTTLGDCLGGQLLAGGPIKEIGTTHWTAPNEGATNSTNFTARPGGSRGSSFEWIGILAYWWSCTDSDDNNAWLQLALNSETGFAADQSVKLYGMSVRCVKD